MQNYFIGGSTGNTRALDDAWQEKKVQVEAAITAGDVRKVAALLDEMAKICMFQGEMELAFEFSEQARNVLDQSRSQPQDRVPDAELKTRMKAIHEKLDEHAKMHAWLKDLQARAMLAFSRKDYQNARFLISQMVAIAKKLGFKEVIKNYRQNLHKVEALMRQP